MVCTYLSQVTYLNPGWLTWLLLKQVRILADPDDLSETQPGRFGTGESPVARLNESDWD